MLICDEIFETRYKRYQHMRGGHGTPVSSCRMGKKGKRKLGGV